MATLNQIIKDRKQQIRNLGKALKTLDTPQERCERRMKRLLQRRYKVPEETDLAKLAEDGAEMAAGLDLFLTMLRQGFPQ